MRLLSLFFVLVTFLLGGCEKTDDTSEFGASYVGTFIRMEDAPASSPMIANVTLHFTQHTFTGTSDSRNYPAICNGTFDINQTKITVKNNCVFTADFYWSLVFQGDYQYEVKGDSLTIWRDAKGYRDVYKLAKED